ncbi:hypothetical protein WR25_22366 [Diploscapter pachys]|uniref:ShKT domain-containing protein n=1 Tax=Diploscapter pachys TaxID=2018661 RepID=A0A2A2KNV1_9BILA|nr:hypothetical protein WR25_22366 [Diploscapter pachys]
MYNAEKKECDNNPNYMNLYCKASCKKCESSYELKDDCTDRSLKCGFWAGEGYCEKYEEWMAENCRNSCKRCEKSRKQVCIEKEQAATAKPPKCDTSGGCFNENVCCSYWAINGECTKSAGYMSCQCPVSCSVCYPEDYNFGLCVDYHKHCKSWAELGECKRNPWMLENCRDSCKSCYSTAHLAEICSKKPGKNVTSSSAGAHPTHSTIRPKPIELPAEPSTPPTKLSNETSFDNEADA